MAIFNKIFQKILKETDNDILENNQKEKSENLINLLYEDDNDFGLNFNNYNPNIKVKKEEEDEDDDSNGRNKDKDRKLEYIEQIKNKVKKEIKNNNGSKQDGDYGLKTSERNLNREIGGMERDYNLELKLELELRSKKRKLYRKFKAEKKISNKKMKSLRSLALFSLSMLRKRLNILKIRKIFKGLLTKKQIKAISSKRNINMQKVKVLKAKIILFNKNYKKHLKKQKENEKMDIIQKFIQNHNMKKKEKRIEQGFIRRM